MQISHGPVFGHFGQFAVTLILGLGFSLILLAFRAAVLPQ
jgi:hypothetical protein